MTLLKWGDTYYRIDAEIIQGLVELALLLRDKRTEIAFLEDRPRCVY